MSRGLALDHPLGQQSHEELHWLLERTMHVKSVLEVGSCLGQSLRMFAAFAEDHARIRAIDLGRLPAAAGRLAGHDTASPLAELRSYLSSVGYDAQICIGDSHALETIGWAQKYGPYDFIFIDGDHSYEGVRADWVAYGPMGKIVAFHDIANPSCGVARLWEEIKAAGHKTEEKIASNMGIGVVYA